MRLRRRMRRRETRSRRPDAAAMAETSAMAMEYQTAAEDGSATARWKRAWRAVWESPRRRTQPPTRAPSTAPLLSARLLPLRYPMREEWVKRCAASASDRARPQTTSLSMPWSRSRLSRLTRPKTEDLSNLATHQARRRDAHLSSGSEIPSRGPQIYADFSGRCGRNLSYLR